MADSTQLALILPCSLCATWRPLADFFRDARLATGHRKDCKDCCRARVKRRFAADPDAHREYLEYQAAYREAHRQENRDYALRYRLANPDKIRSDMEQYRAKPENQLTARQRARAFRMANPARRLEYERRRRANKISTNIGFIKPADLAAKLAYWGNRCWMCKSTEDIQVDHVKPLSKGGPHMLANLRPACRPCNLAKSDRWPLEP